MLLASEKSSGRWLTRNGLARVLLLVVVSLLSLAALALPIAIRPSTYPLLLADVAPQDISAPYALTFTSQVMTDQARDEAEQSVAPVYLPADPAIARRQIEQMRVALNYITTVRLDGYATPEQKYMDLSATASIEVSEELARRILMLTDARWQVVEQEALDVLEAVMRATIREEQSEAALRSIPTLISYSLPEEQAEIVVELVQPFVTANSLYSEQQTQAARDAARESVSPVVRTFIPGEIIVRRGQVITPPAFEALEMFGLVQPSQDYPDLIATTSLVTLVSVFTALYVSRRKSPLLQNPRYLLVIGLTFLVFLFGARFVIPNRAIVPYLFPLAAFGLTVSTLFSLEAGLVFSLVLSILAAYNLPNSLDLTLFYTLSSLCGVLVLGRGRQVASYFWAGIAIGASGAAIIIAYRLPDSYTDWIGITTLAGAAFFHGLASASLTLLLQYFFSQLLGLTTALQLLDLMRPDHPLLQ
ncbi:MAG TPA: hypothetical protein VHO48_05325, partial [Anaerolineaceae bacterium]|nr:hypothetical protein [Anaerolineaceae bacterium]